MLFGPSCFSLSGLPMDQVLEVTSVLSLPHPNAITNLILCEQGYSPKESNKFTKANNGGKML